MFFKIGSGGVNLKKVHKDELSKFKDVENLCQAVEIGMRHGFSLVNIGGSNIYNKDKKLTLVFLWQMMKYDYLKIFTKLGCGPKIRDQQIVEGTNSITSPKGTTITSFKDEQVSDSKPIFTLIDILKPEIIDWSIFENIEEVEKRIRNAKYVLSVVRKFGGQLMPLQKIQ